MGGPGIKGWSPGRGTEVLVNWRARELLPRSLTSSISLMVLSPPPNRSDTSRGCWKAITVSPALDTVTMTTPDERLITYVKRRFLPPALDHHLLVEVTVAEGDRLDLIAARTLGNAEQYWRICDANDAMDPYELTAEPGRVLDIPLPKV